MMSPKLLPPGASSLPGTDLATPHMAPFHSQNHSRELQWLHFRVEEATLREEK